MPKLEAAIAGALALLLSACGGEAASAGNGAAENAAAAAGSDAPGTAPAAEPAQTGEASNSAGEAVPPPDAVSHPNGYLPPAPSEGQTPLANSTDADKVPPATEDQYIRNGQ